MFYVNSLPDSGDICFDHILSLQFAHVVNNFVVKVSVMSWLWCCRSSTVVVAKNESNKQYLLQFAKIYLAIFGHTPVSSVLSVFKHLRKLHS